MRAVRWKFVYGTKCVCTTCVILPMSPPRACGSAFIAVTVPSTAFFTTASGVAWAKAEVETTKAATKADK
jgi:hypothetical protein